MLAEFSFHDLFSQQGESIYMDAREAAVKIVRKIGGKIIGKATPFYEVTVTPVVLHKEDFYKYKTKINL